MNSFGLFIVTPKDVMKRLQLLEGRQRIFSLDSPTLIKLSTSSFLKLENYYRHLPIPIFSIVTFISLLLNFCENNFQQYISVLFRWEQRTSVLSKV